MFRKISLSFLLTLFLLSVSAQSKNADAVKYIAQYAHIAVDNMREYRIPASITMAQGLLESGFGLSVLAKKSNNHFGIKCKKDWTGERVFHDDDEAQECFRKYSCVEDSYADHAVFLTSSQRYAHLFLLPKADFRGWANGLKKAGYATNPKYPSLLINMIELYDLHKLDNPKSAKEFLASLNAAPSTPKPTKPIVSRNKDLVAYYIMGGVNVYRDRKELFVIARKGDSFETLAKSLKMNKKRLYKFNKENKNLKEGDKLYINRKRNK